MTIRGIFQITVLQISDVADSIINSISVLTFVCYNSSILEFCQPVPAM